MKGQISVFVIVLGLVVCLVSGTPTCVRAQDVVLDDLVVITAEVVGIDYVDRALVLLKSDGDVVVIEVSYEARNFDQIELGDMVKAQYYESVAIYLGDRGESPGGSVGLVTARSEAGEKPAGIAVETVDVSASVDRIDKNKRFLYLKGPDGRTTKVKVKQSNKKFNSLSPGDSVLVRYTEAIAISVGKP